MSYKCTYTRFLARFLPPAPLCRGKNRSCGDTSLWSGRTQNLPISSLILVHCVARKNAIGAKMGHFLLLFREQLSLQVPPKKEKNAFFLCNKEGRTINGTPLRRVAVEMCPIKNYQNKTKSRPSLSPIAQKKSLKPGIRCVLYFEKRESRSKHLGRRTKRSLWDAVI